MKNSINPFLGTLVVIAMTQTGHATSDTWDGSQNTGTWSDSANWSTTPATVPGNGDTATFNNAGGAVDVIDLGGSGVTIGNVAFDNALVAAYTIGSGTAATQTLTLNNGGAITASTTLAAGSWSPESSPGTVTISGSHVTYTFPAGPVKTFARLKVTGP